ncbi:DUF4406 domain-containing protein [Amycolatopsis sp. NPDC059027]|uniref:DUF4406 domain-containing protein n=1 Tax=Amycolatopsis sp. NPDC059027 TaxID=3346709 RepID=UPI00366E32CC
MKVYVSGPMTGLPGHNFPAFRAVAAELRAAGYTVEDPSEKGVIEGWTWEDYLRLDLKVLLDCTQVATLPGWTRSRGARLEVRTAKALGMPVRPWRELLP